MNKRIEKLIYKIRVKHMVLLFFVSILPFIEYITLGGVFFFNNTVSVIEVIVTIINLITIFTLILVLVFWLSENWNNRILR